AERLTILSSHPAGLGDMAGFMTRHADADLADAALVFAADREGIHNILTVNRKDFDRYRTPSGKRLKRLWVRD
ncbi:MAG: hypothetical protein FWG56_02075, partial [Desulfovibrionaceae bacterium]|nr:hypothetical protein [Desulfovibrionaceae bacterium]